MEDYYSVLGVHKTATQEEIKLRYKKLVTELHPDKTGGDREAEEKLKKINEAWNELKSTERRKKYDSQQEMHSNFGSGFSDRSNPFRDSGFNFHFGGGHSPFDSIFEHLRQQQRQNATNVSVEYYISLEEAFSGKTTHISISLPDGRQENIDLVIPAGINDGQKIRFQGKGLQYSGKRGDLFVSVRIRPHIRFQRNGQHIITNISVDAIDAMLGTSISVKNIDGTEIQVKIPQGTQHEDTLRCTGKGFSISGLKNRGDLFIIVNIIIPKIIKPEEKVLLNQLKKLREIK